MRFHISRTSSYGDGKPCDTATKAEYIRTDERTFKTFEEHDSRLKEKWLSRGANHRITKAGIARDFENEDWFIEIDSLEKLLEFCKEHGGTLVIEHAFFLGGKEPSLEIYDDYRE